MIYSAKLGASADCANISAHRGWSVLFVCFAQQRHGLRIELSFASLHETTLAKAAHAKGQTLLLDGFWGPGVLHLTPIQVLQRLQRRIEKRMESLQRVKLEGYEPVIRELETELDYLRRATRYLED